MSDEQPVTLPRVHVRAVSNTPGAQFSMSLPIISVEMIGDTLEIVVPVLVKEPSK